MKGCYCLVIELAETSEIEIGKKLGIIRFEKGYYVYVGSAMNSLESRVKRHLSKDKKLRWHVDYLLTSSEITDIVFNVSPRKIECSLSQYIASKTDGVAGFGCSDCSCESHLYHFKTRKHAIECVENAYRSMEIEYEMRTVNG